MKKCRVQLAYKAPFFGWFHVPENLTSETRSVTIHSALQWRKIVHSTKKIQSFIALFSPCAICVKAFIAYRAPNSETSVRLLGDSDCHKTKFNKKKSNLIIRSKACGVQNFFHHSCNNHIYLFLQIFWKHCDSCQNSYIFRHPTESQENCVVHTL